MPPELTNLPPEISPNPAPPAAPTVAPAGEVGAKEFSADGIAEFVVLAEEGGWATDAGPGGGDADFPDLPPTPDPVVSPAAPAAPVPAATPVVPAPQPTVQPAAPARASQQQAPPVVQPPASAVAPGAPAATQVQPAAQVPPAQPVQAPVAPVEPAAVAPAAVAVDPWLTMSNAIKEKEAEFLTALAKQEYSISPEDHEAFISGDTSKLSLLCARIHAGAMRSVMQTVSAYLPVVVHKLVDDGRQADQRENRFWEVNKHLDRGQHRNLLPNIMRTYNQLNPGVDEETRFRAIGLLVAQLHNIPLAAQAQGQPVAPAAPQVRTPGPVVRQVEPPAFAPGGSQGAPPGGTAPQANGTGNPWSQFAEFALANEQGLFDQ